MKTRSRSVSDRLECAFNLFLTIIERFVIHSCPAMAYVLAKVGALCMFDNLHAKTIFMRMKINVSQMMMSHQTLFF